MKPKRISQSLLCAALTVFASASAEAEPVLAPLYRVDRVISTLEGRGAIASLAQLPEWDRLEARVSALEEREGIAPTTFVLSAEKATGDFDDRLESLQCRLCMIILSRECRQKLLGFPLAVDVNQPTGVVWERPPPMVWVMLNHIPRHALKWHILFR